MSRSLTQIKAHMHEVINYTMGCTELELQRHLADLHGRKLTEVELATKSMLRVRLIELRKSLRGPHE